MGQSKRSADSRTKTENRKRPVELDLSNSRTPDLTNEPGMHCFDVEKLFRWRKSSKKDEGLDNSCTYRRTLPDFSYCDQSLLFPEDLYPEMAAEGKGDDQQDVLHRIVLKPDNPFCCSGNDEVTTRYYEMAGTSSNHHPCPKNHANQAAATDRRIAAERNQLKLKSHLEGVQIEKGQGRHIARKYNDDVWVYLKEDGSKIGKVRSQTKEQKHRSEDEKDREIHSRGDPMKSYNDQVRESRRDNSKKSEDDFNMNCHLRDAPETSATGEKQQAISSCTCFCIHRLNLNKKKKDDRQLNMGCTKLTLSRHQRK